jgi:hypothetical protein
MFPDQISRLHAHISSCFHTHAFILSCFMSSCSRFHASCSCLHTHTLSSCPHTFMFMPSCSHGGLPCDGYRIYHWSLHPHDHVHVRQAAPRQKFPFMFPDQISSFHAHMFMPSCSCHHVPTGGSHVTAIESIIGHFTLMITCMSAKPHPVKNFLSCFLIKSDGG